MRPRWPLSLLLLLPAACGGGGREEGNATQSQIERLSTPQAEKQDLSASARLQPLSPEDLERGGVLGAGCAFASDGRLLLAAAGGAAIVRVQGHALRLFAAAPVGPTGGFFEAPPLSVSIGRSSPAGTAAQEASSWPARITVTNRRTRMQQELAGIWTCGA
ncbi:MAG TPA: hypothetical protein VGX37_12705 [Allosphingosinicella sp.]|jgi:hypothetical protein|nr:hypothetical protein [Allosphingosinicella sp.]